jgi:hypothetical protein
MMRRALAGLAAMTILSAGLMAGAQAAPTISHSAIQPESGFVTVAHKHHYRPAVRQSSGEITSFSSSSPGSGVGVNHPAKK